MKIKMGFITVAILLLMGSQIYAASGDLTVGGDLTVNGKFNMLPAGTIIMYAGSAAPAGYLICDGSCVSQTTYADLYLVTGMTYSTSPCSSGEFSLPDFRGVFPKGAGTTNRSAGVDAKGNYYSGTLGSYGQDRVQGHRHLLQGVSGSGTTNSVPDSGAGGNPYDGIVKGPKGGGTVSIGTPYTDGTNGTPRTGSTTEPQSLGVTFIIKY